MEGQYSQRGVKKGPNGAWKTYDDNIVEGGSYILSKKGPNGAWKICDDNNVAAGRLEGGGSSW